MMLADSAQVVTSKLYVLGGGWSTIGPAPAPFAVVLLLEVPWPHLPLAPDRACVWRLSLDSRTEDDRRLTFTTRPQQPTGAVQGGIAAT